MGTVVPEGGVSPSLARMMDDMAAGRIDAVLHVGDMAYDMGDDGGHNGDLFMNQIQPIASMLPYMVTLGATAVAIPHTRVFLPFALPPRAIVGTSRSVRFDGTPWSVLDAMQCRES